MSSPNQVISKITNEPGRLACLCSDLDQASVEDLICVGWFWCCRMSLGGPASLQAQSSCMRKGTRRTWDISQTWHCKTFKNHLNYGPHYSEPASVQERYLSSREGERKVKVQISANSFHPDISSLVFKMEKKHLRNWEHPARPLELHEPNWAQSQPGQQNTNKSYKILPAGMGLQDK